MVAEATGLRPSQDLAAARSPARVAGAKDLLRHWDRAVCATRVARPNQRA